ncbi:MAG TPA: nicotinate-nucleotide adenylyltransferase, partial [Verrucomicrobiales bacterium]|nr:nicotinate-nucleotide adenylyltransferase [Verrucomicrobiales bacterium]
DGPAFATREFEDRICALSLVEYGLADAALFGPDGSIQQAADVFYGKPVLLKRGSFDPVTKLHMDMLERGSAAFRADYGEQADGCLEVMELTMKNLLTHEGTVNKDDFLARADVLQALGKHVLISKYARFFRLSEFVTRHTRKPVGIVMGVPLFEEAFQEKWYEEVPGGLLESFGRMLRNGLRLYVYPMADVGTKEVLSAATARVPEEQKKLLEYLMGIQQIREIPEGDAELMFTSSYEVREMWLRGDPDWEKLVPPEVLRHGRWKK